MRRLFNRVKRTKIVANSDAFRDSQRRYNKAKTIANRNSWRDFYESIKSAEASRLRKILVKDGSSYLDCLKLPNGSYTESVDKFLKHLMLTHFAGFRF